MEAKHNSRHKVEGKYLTFGLGQEEYGIGILKVKEIIGMQPIRSMPRFPASIRGVVQLRDEIIPIVDLRTCFAMPSEQVFW